MAAAIVASVSTGVMKPLLCKLATLMGDEFSKLKNLRKEVKFISDELTSMKDVLESLADVYDLDLQTKRWRDIVREMSYDIENIIDDFMHKIGEKNGKGALIRRTIRRLKTSRARRQIVDQIGAIKKLVCETSERRSRYKFDIPRSSYVTIDPRVATLYKDAATLVGLEGPTNELVNWLKDEEAHLKKVSIVGFGGLGKTTLANEVYGRLKEEFNCGAFVSVSQKPNITKIIRSLLSELGSTLSLHDCEINVLLNKLREYLQKKRYLVIIDDLWDTSSWDIIKSAFPDNGLSSRVITTTRINNVAEACCSPSRDYIFKMKTLNNEDSRRLFFGRIFNSEEDCPPQLQNVSTEILKKCDGLPLAIITISGMLANEGFDQEDWEHVHNSLGSGTNLTLEGMRKILDLSYRNLPPHLKTCLLYLGMYPEDFRIDRSKLERQWIAKGFVTKENGQDVEKVARNYFNELVNRSLIQPIVFNYEGFVTKCTVHDMMLDLILFKCAEENFLTIFDGRQAITKLDYKVRRLSLQLNGPYDGSSLSGKVSMSQIRTIMIFGGSAMPHLPLFKFLRVLDVHGSMIVEGNFIGLCKLYQLRYLAIHGFWNLFKLPAQIKGLRHLETLDAPLGVYVPSDIVHLPWLKFSNIDWSRNQLPDGFGRIKSLRYLNRFDVMKSSLDSVEGLGELTNLREIVVCGSTSEGVVSDTDRKRRMDALISSLGKICMSLECLGLHISGCNNAFMALSPPPHRLERLHMGVQSFFSRVPNWMGKLNNLKQLDIIVLWSDISILAELPALTHVKVYIKEILTETIIIYERAFPVVRSLELRLSNPSYLTFQAGAMPRLQRLRLEYNGRGLKQNGGPGPTGIQHLLALEEFSAEIRISDSTEFERTIAESALRSCIGVHPIGPHVEIQFHDELDWSFFSSYDFLCLSSDDSDSDDFDSWEHRRVYTHGPSRMQELLLSL